MRILLAEDDSVLSDGISIALKQTGYAVDQVSCGEDADWALKNYRYDMAILDLGLPKIDGLDVLKAFREQNSQVPVLILTARDSLEDRVTGLDLGADDYLTKPFDLPELEARIRALLRRKQFATQPTEIRVNDLRFQPLTRSLFDKEDLIELSAKEVSVFELLLSHRGQVVSKEQFVEHLYGWDETVGDNAIEVTIHRLRKKLEPYGIEIRTIRGLGYMMVNA